MTGFRYSRTADRTAGMQAWKHFEKIRELISIAPLFNKCSPVST
jgi:hypothetical protein